MTIEQLRTFEALLDERGYEKTNRTKIFAESEEGDYGWLKYFTTFGKALPSYEVVVGITDLSKSDTWGAVIDKAERIKVTVSATSYDLCGTYSRSILLSEEMPDLDAAEGLARDYMASTVYYLRNYHGIRE